MQQRQCSVPSRWPTTPLLLSLWSQATSNLCRSVDSIASNHDHASDSMMDKAHAIPAGCWLQVSMTAELKQLVATLSREANAAATEALVVAGSNALRSEVHWLTGARHEWHGLAALNSTCRLQEPSVHDCILHIVSHQL
jgi:hypothetical protein